METSNSHHNSGHSETPKHKHSKIFIWIVAALAGLIVLVAVFSLGVTVGFHKASFTYSWASNYSNNFGQPGGRGFMQAPPTGQFFNDHGLDGTILSIDQNSVVIKDEDSNEKTVLISPTTTIRQGSGNITAAGLKTGQEIVVIGEANNLGQVEAKFVRVFNAQ